MKAQHKYLIKKLVHAAINVGRLHESVGSMRPEDAEAALKQADRELVAATSKLIHALNPCTEDILDIITPDKPPKE